MTASGTKANAHVGAADVTALTGINAHVDAIHVTTSKANANPPRGYSRHDNLGRERERPRGRAQQLDAAAVRTRAQATLTGLGWKAAIAHAAVAAAAVHGTEMTLERLPPDVDAADVPVLTMPMPRERDK